MIRFVTDKLPWAFSTLPHANFFKNLRKVLHQVSFETTSVWNRIPKTIFNSRKIYLNFLKLWEWKKKFKKDVHVRS